MKKIRDYVYVPSRFMPHRPEPGARRDAYDALVDGLLEYRGSVRLPRGVTMEDLDGLVDVVKLDFPELFYVGSGTVTSRMLGPCQVSLEYAPRYRLGEKDVLSTLESMERASDEVVRELTLARPQVLPGAVAYDDHTLEDLATLHDWLVRHFTYADGDRPYAYEAPGPLVYGVGVCEGVAKAYKYLCDRCGLACCVVTGEAQDPGCPARGPEPHAWNLVRVPSREVWWHRDEPPACHDPEWANVDVTFDASLSHAIVRHDYFGVTDAAIAASHRRDASSPLPAAGASLRYYESNNLVATAATRLAQIVDFDLPRRGGAEFVMPCIWGGRPQVDRAVEHGLAKSSELGRAGRAYAIYPNYDRMVFGVEALS